MAYDTAKSLASGQLFLSASCAATLHPPACGQTLLHHLQARQPCRRSFHSPILWLTCGRQTQAHADDGKASVLSTAARVACGNAECWGCCWLRLTLARTNNGRRKKPTQGISAGDGASWLSHALLLPTLACMVVRRRKLRHPRRHRFSFAAGSSRQVLWLFRWLEACSKEGLVRRASPTACRAWMDTSTNGCRCHHACRPNALTWPS